ncbi:DUF3833 family protein [Jiella sp. M17.18]|uniref:DUF3833 family protein n=1 Tax=Jiella sp. M17.18 TaxID=3234247 RepID=UPI0034E017D2
MTAASPRLSPRRTRSPVGLAVAACLAFAFAAVDAGSAQAQSAAFSLPAFFDGTSYSAGVTRTALFFTDAFTARFKGVRSGSHLRLDEHFRFPDGARLQRWNLTETPSGGFSGTVTTELGTGAMAPAVPVRGFTRGDHVVLVYDGYAPGGGTTLLGFRHVMTPQPGGTVENHVTVYKFGIPVATSDVIFSKRPLKPAGQ